MAMPSGNVVKPEKMQFANGGGVRTGVNGGACGEIHQEHHRQWFADERDCFISWLRGEFAAANAIIDGLCHHLRVVSDPGEYDMVIATIQQRRSNWNQALHMQQFFPVSEVEYTLQQAQWRRQQRYVDPVKSGGKDKRSGSVFKQGYRTDASKEGHNSHIGSNSRNTKSFMVATSAPDNGISPSDKTADTKPINKVGKLEDKTVELTEHHKGDVAKHHDSSSVTSSLCSQGSLYHSDSEILVSKDGPTTTSKGYLLPDNNSHSLQNPNAEPTEPSAAKTFVRTETCDGKLVNVVEGLMSYEEFLSEAEVSKFLSLVNDLRSSGKRGQCQGQTFVVSKRPMKGHGREKIQLGFPLADPPLEEESLLSSAEDRKVEPIPVLVQDIIERLFATHITTVKPDACVIDIYNEGDYSQPHIWPSWFGRPVCVLFLTECDMTFGKVIMLDHAGDYRGSLNLSLTPGSLLLMEGKSSDFAKHAIPSIHKQRIIVTLTKYLPKKSTLSDGTRHHSSSAPSPHWGPSPGRSPSYLRHHGGLKHYFNSPTTGVLPPPAIPSLIPPNGIRPLFVTNTVAQPIPFPCPVLGPPGSWLPATPAPRILAPGTGVFFPPPGSGNPTFQQSPGLTAGVNLKAEHDDASGKRNHISNTSPESNPDCNGSIGGADSLQAIKYEQGSVDKTKASDSISSD